MRFVRQYWDAASRCEGRFWHSPWMDNRELDRMNTMANTVPPPKAPTTTLPSLPAAGGCVALTALLLLAGTACTPPAGAPEVEFRIPVEVDEVVAATVEDLVIATGTLRARGIVRLTAETPGHLQVSRDAGGERLAEGSVVTAGQLVARVTGEDARIHARLESPRRSMEAAAAQLARRRELFDAKLASEEELQQAEERLENARLEYDRSTLNAAKASLKTPIDGTILRLARDNNGQPMADGQLVSSGFAVAEVAPLDELVADVDLIGPELARVRRGQEARIRHYAFKEAALSGRVLRLSPTMDPIKRTFRAEVLVENQAMLLRPGMFVEVTVVVEQRPDVAVVPRQAVANRGGRDVVFFLDGQRVSRRDVRLGLGDDDIVQVFEGVALGDRVVVRGLETLVDGTRVRVIGG